MGVVHEAPAFVGAVGLADVADGELRLPEHDALPAVVVEHAQRGAGGGHVGDVWRCGHSSHHVAVRHGVGGGADGHRAGGDARARREGERAVVADEGVAVRLGQRHGHREALGARRREGGAHRRLAALGDLGWGDDEFQHAGLAHGDHAAEEVAPAQGHRDAGRHRPGVGLGQGAVAGDAFQGHQQAFVALRLGVGRGGDARQGRARLQRGGGAAAGRREVRLGEMERGRRDGEIVGAGFADEGGGAPAEGQGGGVEVQPVEVAGGAEGAVRHRAQHRVGGEFGALKHRRVGRLDREGEGRGGEVVVAHLDRGRGGGGVDGVAIAGQQRDAHRAVGLVAAVVDHRVVFDAGGAGRDHRPARALPVRRHEVAAGLADEQFDGEVRGHRAAGADHEAAAGGGRLALELVVVGAVVHLGRRLQGEFRGIVVEDGDGGFGAGDGRFWRRVVEGDEEGLRRFVVLVVGDRNAHGREARPDGQGHGAG